MGQPTDRPEPLTKNPSDGRPTVGVPLLVILSFVGLLGVILPVTFVLLLLLALLRKLAGLNPIKAGRRKSVYP